MIDLDDEVNEIITYDLASVVEDEPQLRRVVDALRAHPSAYFSCYARFLPSLLAQHNGYDRVIILSSRRISDGWPVTINEVDVVVDAFDRTYNDSMSYLSWSAPDQSIGIKIEEIATIFEDDFTFQGEPTHIIWITDNELAIGSLDITEYRCDKFPVADKLYKLSRYIPDEEYISVKLGSFPPLLSADERRCINGEGQPLYIARAVKLDTK